VAIARALVTNPSILLADEPTGALDSDSSKMVMDLLKRLNQDGKTVIVITHDPLVAGECRRVVRLADGRVADNIETFFTETL
jgi:putative ABC transport system ATP-binding protein